MKKILYLMFICLFLAGCKDNDENNCNCDYPQWVIEELRYYKEKTAESGGEVYFLQKDTEKYYGIRDMADASLTMTLRLFTSDGTPIDKDDENYAELLQLFLDGEFTRCSLNEYN